MGSLASYSSFSSFSSLLLFFSLLLSSLVNGRNTSDPSITPIKHDLYHSSEALITEIKALVGRNPERLSMKAIKTGNKGYNAEVLVVTYGHASKNTNDSSKFRILLSFGQHGRELITSEVAFRLLSILSGEKSTPKIDPNSLNRTLEKLVIKVVPMENLNGRRLVEAGDLCERRNGRGVDLNRNWSVDWGKKEKDYDPYEENPGLAPFSEPETQIMRKISKSFNPHIWVNVHSGMEALFMPYDHRNTTPDGSTSDKMKIMLKDLNRLHCHERCSIGSGGASVGYLAHGTATDYMYDVVKVPMAFTFEIYGDGEASSKDCFRMFNPIDQPTFNRVINDWCAAFLTIFHKGPQHLGFHSGSSVTNLHEWISIDEYLDGYLMERSSRYGKKTQVLELGMQEIRTYFRLFLLSSVLLLFMFCSRISKTNYRQVVSGIPF
ncbi:hypothetical protein NE237_022813 [Protea cynaroides]|uniref:Peptidase M14 domain-containing protein n=1 Tax=Protea cynaroides TaxID=273540 RepID=A0A9Q0HG13_9MAGN|nr:hypothetical protein NE237_022813 [Protea cynaroides]